MRIALPVLLALILAGCDDRPATYQQTRIASLEDQLTRARDEAERLHSLNSQILAAQRETIVQLEAERARGQAQGDEARSGRSLSTLLTVSVVILGCGLAIVLVARRRSRVPGRA